MKPYLLIILFVLGGCKAFNSNAYEDQTAANDACVDAQNKYDMSVTPPVSHVEMWPYVASADALFESHAETAVLILLSVMTPASARRG